MDNVVVTLKLQRLKNLNSKPPNQPNGNPLEVVGLNELIQIHAKQFKLDQQVSSEDFVVNDPDNIVVIVFVPVFEILQNFKLHTCLILKPFFVADNLDSHHLVFFVVKAFKCLPKTATADFVNDFVSESQLIFHHNLVIPSVVVITEVMIILARTLNLRGSEAEEKNFSIILDFYLFIIGQSLAVVQTQCLSAIHWECGRLFCHSNRATWLLRVGIVLWPKICFVLHGRSLNLLRLWSCVLLGWLRFGIGN